MLHWPPRHSRGAHEAAGVVAGLAVAGAARPLRAVPQASARPVIGYLDASGLPPWFEAFQRGLAEVGYLPREAIVEYCSGAGRAERLPELAAELVRLRPRVLVVSGSAAAVAAQKATATIPIVFAVMRRLSASPPADMACLPEPPSESVEWKR